MENWAKKETPEENNTIFFYKVSCNRNFYICLYAKRVFEVY